MELMEKMELEWRNGIRMEKMEFRNGENGIRMEIRMEKMEQNRPDTFVDTKDEKIQDPRHRMQKSMTDFVSPSHTLVRERLYGPTLTFSHLYQGTACPGRLLHGVPCFVCPSILHLASRHKNSPTLCLELGAGDLSERTQLKELEEDVHFVFR